MKVKKYFRTSDYHKAWIKEVSECDSLKQMLHFYRNFVEIQDGDFVLDLGVGEGRLANFLMKPNVEYVGVDISIHIIRRTRENLSCKKEGSLHLVLADAENLPFKDRSFSKLLCFETTFFIPNQEKLIREISRTLNKNGVFYSEFLNRSNFYILINDWILNRVFTAIIKLVSRADAVTKFVFRVFQKTTKREYGFKNEWIRVFRDFGAPKHYPIPSSVFFSLLSKNDLKVKEALGFDSRGLLKTSSPESCRRILVKAVRK